MLSVMPKTPLKTADHFVNHTISPKIRAFFRISFLAMWLIFLIVPLCITNWLKRLQWRDAVMQFGTRGVLFIIGARVHLIGELADKRPLMLVSNHISYVDVCVLNACANVKFTPKEEILSWPVFGLISKLSGAIFINRRADKITAARHVIKERIGAGDVICIFPEATTGTGLFVKPFRSAFFSLAQEEYNNRPLHIQPAALIYKNISGMRIDSNQWPKIAWYGDMDLAPHLWELLQLPNLDIELRFLPSMAVEQHMDRKDIAKHCQKLISDTIEESRQKPPKPLIKAASSFKPKRMRRS